MVFIYCESLLKQSETYKNESKQCFYTIISQFGIMESHKISWKNHGILLSIVCMNHNLFYINFHLICCFSLLIHYKALIFKLLSLSVATDANRSFTALEIACDSLVGTGEHAREKIMEA